MNILDENIPANQRQLLETRRIHVRQLGFDLGRRGLTDDDIIPLLLQQNCPTFFTRDDDFYDRRLCHLRYCLVYLAVEKNTVAEFVQRVLRHPDCTKRAQRLGSVIRVGKAGLSIWRLHAKSALSVEWPKKNK